MRRILVFLLNLCVFILIACLPSLIVEQKINFFSYLLSLKDIVSRLVHPLDIVFINQKSGVKHDIWPFIFRPWLNTLSILLGSLVVSLIITLLLSFVMYKNKKLNDVINSINSFLTILPDIFYIPIFIGFIIVFYIKTGVLIIDVASSSENSVILLPVLLLTIVPLTKSIDLIQNLLVVEKRALYVEFAKSKGISENSIFFNHILGNLIVEYFINFKHLIWITLSSTLFLERLLNVLGISVFIFEYNSPEVLVVSFVLLYLSINIIFFVINQLTKAISGRGMDQ